MPHRSLILSRRLLVSATCAFTCAFAYTTPHAQSVDKDTIVAAFGAESTTLNPVKISGGVDYYFVSQIFETLTRSDPDFQKINWLAKDWEIDNEDPEKPVIYVELRDDVYFHNGDKMTSEDVQFSFDYMQESGFFKHYIASVEKVEIIDPLRVAIHFNKPDASFVSNDFRIYILPKKYFNEVGEEEFGKRPVGTGPWQLESRKVKEEIRFKRFEDYWNKEHQPKIDNFVIKVIPEDTTRVSAFKTGKVDWIDNVPPAQVEDIKALPDVATTTVISGNNLLLNFPTYDESTPFYKREVRLAIAHALDMEAIIKSVLFEQGQAYAQVGEGEVGYDPDLEPYEYNPELARELLAKAGYPNGFDTPCYNLITPREPNVKEVGEAMFAYLSAVGIRCQLRGLEYGAWLALGKRAGETPMNGIINWMWSHGLPGDPGTAWLGHWASYDQETGTGTYSYDNNPEADALLAQQNTIMDPEERDDFVRKLVHMKQEGAEGGIPTYRPMVTFAWRDNLDYTMWPIRDYWRSFQEVNWKD